MCNIIIVKGIRKFIQLLSVYFGCNCYYLKSHLMFSEVRPPVDHLGRGHTGSTPPSPIETALPFLTWKTNDSRTTMILQRKAAI